MQKLSMVFLVPGLPFDGNTMETKSLGGSETAGLCMAREMAKMGHIVKMFCNTDTHAEYEGVNYYNASEWVTFVTSVPHDVAIVERSPEALRCRTNSKLNILWMHDLALGRQADDVRATMWNVDQMFLLSDFHKKQYLDVYGLPEKFLWQTRNGIDLFRFPELVHGGNSRERKRLVYSARPERGLDNMLSIFGRLLERDPDFSLVIYGYDNPVDHLAEFYGALQAQAASFGGKVTFGGCLTKNALYEEYSRSGLYVYPTPSIVSPDFAEISCISAMEAQAAGLPIVTSVKGALPETVAQGAGVLIDGDPWSDAYRDQFCDAVMHLVTDDAVYATAQDVGSAAAKRMSWAKVAREWTEHFEQMMAERSADRLRLAHHFYRRSDIEAARKCLQYESTLTAAGLRLQAKIDAEYKFTKSPKLLRAHYARNGKETDRRLASVPLETYKFDTTEEPRFQAIERIIAARPEIKTVLEYGCGHGWSGVYLNKKLGKEWTGVDIDPGAVTWANRFAEKEGIAESTHFMEGDHTNLPGWAGEYDCLIVSEVLEHCVDPVAVMRALESMVKDGGLIIVTVPYGPSEYGTVNWSDFRNHLWEFEHADLMDIFGAKPEYSLASNPIYPNAVTGEMIGFHMVCYLQRPAAPLGEIDWERKLNCQSPRDTISANIIAGPGCEDTLLWSLNSLKDVVDDVVIADTGMSGVARMMAESCGARLIKGTPPLEGGFETPRNESLASTETDWVLWIDTDEKMIGGIELVKYLRNSMWGGLSIRQHHFTVDASFTPDMPVRCFRRFSHDGRQMRFFGMIHEHPELEMNKGPGEVIILPDVHIAHVGYLSETIRRGRFGRNYPMMEKDQEVYPNRLLQKHFIMRDQMLMVMYELSTNGGRLTPVIRDRCEEVCRLYKEHFHAKAGYSNIDGLSYYSEALKILNRGIDVSWAFGASRAGIGEQQPTGTITARFETIEEAQREITFRLSQKLDRFKGDYF